jgi:hypothetical protein
MTDSVLVEWSSPMSLWMSDEGQGAEMEDAYEGRPFYPLRVFFERWRKRSCVAGQGLVNLR